VDAAFEEIDPTDDDLCEVELAERLFFRLADVARFLVMRLTVPLCEWLGVPTSEIRQKFPPPALA
jgi:hypothetical protein